MGDGSLSQDEIDALLQGSDDDVGGIPDNIAMPAGSGGGPAMPAAEQNAVKNSLRSIVSIVIPSLAGYLGGRNISLTNVVIESKANGAIANDFPGRHVQVGMDYQGVLNGKNLVLFTVPDAGLISSLMMSDETGTQVELTEAHLSTIQEFTNQFLSSMATQFGNKLGGGVSTTPANLSMSNGPADLQIPLGSAIKITYDLNIEGVSAFKIFHIMDMTIATAIAPQGGGGPQQQQYGGGRQQQQQQQQQYAGGPMTDMSAVKFPQLDTGITQSALGDISLLLDVPMTLTVELGRTSRLVQEILGLGEGSIIELDKLAGEPVDLLVNGKLIAKGEVVVIDENFGVRVTDIVSPDERLIHVSH
ncbi:MAG: flagellar motor switch protein FliN [Spirochaetia bacterium]|nr:flagellar motor switch protein FliN [Spirochaetia bacterium]